MTNQDVINLGFKPVDTFTVQNSHNYDLGRGRFLSIGDVGRPNEMLFICQSSKDDPKKIDDVVCIYNYDYDGYLTVEKLQKIIDAIGGK